MMPEQTAIQRKNLEDEMTQQQRSQIVPYLVAALVCDVAVPDPSTNKKTLIGIFDRINVGNFPAARPVSVYFKITDAEGYYDIEVRYVRVATDEKLAEAQGQFQIDQRLASFDAIISFPPLSIPAEGRYEFQLWANDMFLGSTFLDAVLRPGPNS